MARLAYVEVYFRDVRFEDGQLRQLTQTVSEIGAEIGGVHFDVPIDITFRVEDGSFKVVATVIGMLFSTYYFVGNYKAFKEGVMEICKDANDFGNDFCDKVIAVVDLKKGPEPQSSPARYVDEETPGRLRELLEDLEKLDDQKLNPEIRWQSLPVESRRIRLMEMAKKLDKVLEDVSPKEQAAITSSLKFENLPPVSEWPREKVSHEPIRAVRHEERPLLESKRPKRKPTPASRVWEYTVAVVPKRTGGSGAS